MTSLKRFDQQQRTEWETMICKSDMQIIYMIRDFYLEYIDNSTLKQQKQITQLESRQKNLYSQFPGEDIQMTKKHKLLLLSPFSRVRLCATPQTAAHQAPPSLGFSRQEHWSGLPFPSPMHESEK